MRLRALVVLVTLAIVISLPIVHAYGLATYHGGSKPSKYKTIVPKKSVTSSKNPEVKTAQIPKKIQIDKSKFKKAPPLSGISGYINTDKNAIYSEMKNKVILYDFWTYGCYNCQNTIPYIKAWYDKYADKGLLIIGIHTPEFEFEKDIGNVKQAVVKSDIKFPVVLDNDEQNWRAFENHYWPRFYLADSDGYIRYDHIGEGSYDETEQAIQQLLKERNDSA